MQRLAHALLAGRLGDAVGAHDALRIFQVVGIVDHGDVAVVAPAAPDVFDQLGLAAVAGGIVALGQAAVIVAAHARRLLHGRDGVGIVGVHAAEDLVVGRIHDVVVPAGADLAQDIRARGDGLCLERLDGEAVAHLIGHDAQQIVLHVDGQYRPDDALRRGQQQVALIEVASALQAHAVLLALRRRMAREGGLCAQVDRHALVVQDQLPVAQRHRYLRPARKGQQVVLARRVYAVEADVHLVLDLQAAEQHAHAAVPALRGGRRRRVQRRQRAQRQG